MTDGFLTTHVVDPVRGIPAVDMKIDLNRIEGDAWTHLATKWTNWDGRMDEPIPPVGDFGVGKYELLFYAVAWFD